MILKLCVILLVGIVDCGRILVYVPTPSFSHQVVFRPFVQELVKRGHECVVVTANPAFPKGKTPQNLTEIDIHDVSYDNIQEVLKKLTGEKGNYLVTLNKIFTQMSIIFEMQLQQPDVKEVLRPNTFDLIIAESYLRPILGLSHYLKAPMILMSTFGALPLQYGMLGAPTHPLLYPYYIQHKTNNLSLLIKMEQIMNYIQFEYNEYCFESLDYDIMRRNFGKDVPSFRELHKKYVQMLFINEHPVWAHNRPVPPNIKYIGGIHTPEERPLPKDIKSYLDAAKRGVIYFSLGSNVRPSLLPSDKTSMMLKVLSRMPYDVLFKWDNDNHTEEYKNIKFFKWTPQADLLKHPNIKLFVTQGGLQSTDEAINAAVPLIVIPIFGDQYYNAEKYEQLKIGIQLDLGSVTEEQFEEAVVAVTGDVSYKNNILKLRSQMREVPISSLDLAVWWMEHILKYGGEHLQPPSAGLTWVEYYEIPLISVLLIIVVIILLIAFIILKFLWMLFNILRANSKLKTT